MKIVFLVARILLGLMFVVLGLNGFIFFWPPPATLPPLMTEFNHATITSHFTWLPMGVQVIAGLMLLANRYVPLALVLLAAIIANVLMLHITMFLIGIPGALLALVLWFIVAWPLRAQFAPLFVQKVDAT